MKLRVYRGVTYVSVPTAKLSRYESLLIVQPLPEDVYGPVN
jgi:hypothetical protein